MSNPLHAENLDKEIVRTIEDGAKVTLKFHWDIGHEVMSKRGIHMHRVDAYMCGQRVGYIKTDYIPSWGYIPNIYDYAEHCGECGIGKGWKEYQETGDPSRFIRRACSYHMSVRRMNECIEETKQNINLESNFETLKQRIHSYHEEGFKSYLEFNVDKPLVNYSFVESDFRRRGIGFLMYVELSRWLQDHDLPGLYASNTQTNASYSTWMYLEEHSNVETETYYSEAEDKEKTRRLLVA